MLTENKKALDVLGITKWHDAGYTGKRGVSLTYEPTDTGHGYATAFVFREAAPGRKLLSAFGVADAAKLIKDNHIDCGFRSLADYNGYSDAMKLPDETLDFCSLFNSAGNENDGAYSKNIDLECWFGVGAVGADNTPYAYTSTSPYVDFGSRANIYVKYPTGVVNPFDGTSCAAPLLAAMAAIVNDFFYDKRGRPLGHYEMYNFLKACSVDVAPIGKDNKTGWGVPVLPDPATINPADWITHTKIELELGSTTYYVNGLEKTMDVAPFAQNNRTYVPIRFVGEEFEYTVKWDPAQPKKVIIAK